MAPGKRSIGLSLIGYNLASAELVELAKSAETSGFDSAWTGDYFRDALVQAAVVAKETTTIRIGTAVALAFVRSPLATAVAALDLDEATDGRFTLGLGPQVKKVMERWHGLPHSQPAARIADCVGAIRAAMHAGEESKVRYEGPFYALDLSEYQRPLFAQRRIPIHLAAAGPIMVKTACRVADGVLGHIFWSDRYFDVVVRPALAQTDTSFERCVTIVSAVSDVEAVARADAKRTIGFYAATGTYRGMLEEDGFAAQAAEAREALIARDERRLEDSVTDEMLATYALAGTPAQVREQLETRQLDVDTVILLPGYFRTPKDRLLAQMRALVDAFATAKSAAS